MSGSRNLPLPDAHPHPGDHHDAAARPEPGAERRMEEQEDGLVDVGRHGQLLDAAVGELDPSVAVVGKPQVALIAPIPLARQKLAQQGVQRGGVPRGGGLLRSRGRFPGAAIPPLAGAGIVTGHNFGRHIEVFHVASKGGRCARAPMPPKSHRQPPRQSRHRQGKIIRTSSVLNPASRPRWMNCKRRTSSPPNSRQSLPVRGAIRPTSS